MTDSLRRDWMEMNASATAVVHSHHVEFKVFMHEGIEFDADGSHTPVLNDADPEITGEVRWDGCSNWHPAQCIHFCTRESIPQLGLAMQACWDWARELLPNFSE